MFSLSLFITLDNMFVKKTKLPKTAKVYKTPKPNLKKTKNPRKWA